MTTRYIVHKPTGIRYAWQPAFDPATNDAFVDDAIDVEVREVPERTLRLKPSRAGLKSSTEDSLGVDASRRLP